jgi:DNA-binding NtrC family response regulator
MQVKLLRALQEKKLTPIGSNREIEVNVRIIAATNRNLEEMIKKNEFREDLFYRLNVLPIQLPPLRDRKSDIEDLSKYFIEKFNTQHRKNITGIAPDAMEAMKAHQWPGNIRELENVIEHAFVIETADEISSESLPEAVLNSARSKGLVLGKVISTGISAESFAGDDVDMDIPLQVSNGTLTIGEGLDEAGFKLDFTKLDFQANKEEFEKRFLISALKAFNGRINQTALHANIPKKTLLRKLEKYGIVAKNFTE